jgi:hypothetical protein
MTPVPAAAARNIKIAVGGVELISSLYMMSGMMV